ncbi:hypothetical protein [Hymenobacter jeollabukensis]|uniref:Uncharacterized protein n=1 Tax=Hymenobacter jeollabukensis TaxID=2025313 RepID=A0A5R8WHU9_9BACT|nr:hypothetical protein [Hymenobacter jeollabukensis]TLM87297.1 hypothetical protein FDY95_26095 [Hymenobacter jeollabukensis]
MSEVKEHAAAFEAAVGQASAALGFASPAEYLHDRSSNARGARFLAVEVLAELRAAGWRLTWVDVEDE